MADADTCAQNSAAQMKSIKTYRIAFARAGLVLKTFDEQTFELYTRENDELPFAGNLSIGDLDPWLYWSKIRRESIRSIERYNWPVLTMSQEERLTHRRDCRAMVPCDVCGSGYYRPGDEIELMVYRSDRSLVPISWSVLNFPGSSARIQQLRDAALKAPSPPATQ